MAAATVSEGGALSASAHVSPLLERLLDVHAHLIPASLTAPQQKTVFSVVSALFFDRATPNHSNSSRGGGSSSNSSSKSGTSPFSGVEGESLVDCICQKLQGLCLSTTEVEGQSPSNNEQSSAFSFLCTCLVQQVGRRPSILTKFYERVACAVLHSENSGFEHVVYATLGEMLVETNTAASLSPPGAQNNDLLNASHSPSDGICQHLLEQLQSGKAESSPKRILVCVKLAAVLLSSMPSTVSTGGCDANSNDSDGMQLAGFLELNFLRLLGLANVGLSDGSPLSSRCQYIFLVDLLPTLLEIFGTKMALEVWAQVRGNQTSSELHIPLTLRCLLAGVIGENTEGTLDAIFATRDLWVLIQSALSDGSGSVNKVGVSLLEHCVASLNRQLESFAECNNVVGEDHQARKQRLAVEKEQRAASKRWDTFVDMFETTDQFAIHMVDPVWTQLVTLCGGGRKRGRGKARQGVTGEDVSQVFGPVPPKSWKASSSIRDCADDEGRVGSVDGATATEDPSILCATSSELHRCVLYCIRGHALATASLLVGKLVRHHNPRVRLTMIKRLLTPNAKPVWRHLAIASVQDEHEDVMCSAVIPALCDYSLYAGAGGVSASDSVVFFLAEYTRELGNADSASRNSTSSDSSSQQRFLSRLLFQMAKQTSSPGIRTLLRLFSGEQRLLSQDLGSIAAQSGDAEPAADRVYLFGPEHLHALSAALRSNFLNVPRSVRQPVYQGLLDILIFYTGTEASAGSLVGECTAVPSMAAALKSFLSHFQISKHLAPRAPELCQWLRESPVLHRQLGQNVAAFLQQQMDFRMEKKNVVSSTTPIPTTHAFRYRTHAVLFWLLCGTFAGHGDPNIGDVPVGRREQASLGASTSALIKHVPALTHWTGLLAGIYSRAYMPSESACSAVQWLAALLTVFLESETSSSKFTTAAAQVIHQQLDHFLATSLTGIETEILGFVEAGIMSSQNGIDNSSPALLDPDFRQTLVDVLVKLSSFCSLSKFVDTAMLEAVQRRCARIVQYFGSQIAPSPLEHKSLQDDALSNHPQQHHNVALLHAVAHPCAQLVRHCGSFLDPATSGLWESLAHAALRLDVSSQPTAIRRSVYQAKWSLLATVTKGSSAAQSTHLHALCDSTIDTLMQELSNGIPTAAVARDLLPQLQCLMCILPRSAALCTSEPCNGSGETDESSPSDDHESSTRMECLVDTLSGAWSAFLDLPRAEQMAPSVVLSIVGVLFHSCLFAHGVLFHASIKRHFANVLAYSDQTQRKDIVQMMASQLCDAWGRHARSQPAAAASIPRESHPFLNLLAYLDEIATLCVFSEFNPESDQPLEAPINIVDYTRVVVLTWLNGILNASGASFETCLTSQQEGKTQCSSPFCTVQARMFALKLVHRLMAFNFPRQSPNGSGNASKQAAGTVYMPDSAVQRQKCRIWQAIGVLIQYVPDNSLDSNTDDTQDIGCGVVRCLNQMHQPQVRFLIEMVAGALAIRFPRKFFCRLVLPALRDYDQQPQCAMSYLIITTCVVSSLSNSSKQTAAIDAHESTAAVSTTDPQGHPILVEVHHDLCIYVATWLGAPDGLARTIAQYAMFVVVTALTPLASNKGLSLPSSAGPANPYVAEQLAFLRENRKCAKMREKQHRIFHSLNPVHECTLPALLAHASGYDHEFSTGNLLADVRDAMESIFAYFTELDGPMVGAHSRELQMKADKRAQLEELEILLERQYIEAQREAVAARSTSEVAGENCVDGDTTGMGLVSEAYVQRKVLPWKMHELIGAANHDKELLVASGARQRVQNLIVCASLVDKVPNLAGFARTCEIFAATELVIPDKVTSAVGYWSWHANNCDPSVTLFTRVSNMVCHCRGC